jgi:hypothetical protein
MQVWSFQDIGQFELTDCTVLSGPPLTETVTVHW